MFGALGRAADWPTFAPRANLVGTVTTAWVALPMSLVVWPGDERKPDQTGTAHELKIGFLLELVRS